MALRASVQKAQVAAKPQRRVAAKAVRPVAALNAKAATAAAAVAVATVAACAPVGRLQQGTVRDSGCACSSQSRRSRRWVSSARSQGSSAAVSSVRLLRTPLDLGSAPVLALS
jgi:hypothetical protein